MNSDDVSDEGTRNKTALFEKEEEEEEAEVEGEEEEDEEETKRECEGK